MRALLDILSGERPALSSDNPYKSVLEAVQTSIADGGTSPERFAEMSEDETARFMNAVKATLTADDLPSLRKVIEENREILFNPEVESIFRANIEQARRSGQQQFAEKLSFLLGVLQACKADGIDVIFARLAAVEREGEGELPASELSSAGGLPADFVRRCVEGITGTPQEKQSLFEYLVELAPKVPEAGELIRVVQKAIFGEAPGSLGENLDGQYAQVWHEICREIESKQS